ncbi:MAG: sigma-70 family RNA polymerase sigma factor [Blastocatellales bacterium]
MDGSTQQDVTQLLLAWGEGDEAARDQLIPMVYDHLRKLARYRLRGERDGHTLQTAALVNEAYLRLVEQPVAWQNRAQFFGIAAHLMRQILVNHAVARGRLKRGGEQFQVSLTAAADVADTQAADVLALDEALKTLAEFDPQKSRIIELRFFGGLTIDETAAALGISTATVEREWRAARAWLQAEMSGG